MKGTTVAIVGIVLVGGWYALHKVGGAIEKGVYHTCPICVGHEGSQECAQCLKQKLGTSQAAYVRRAYDSDSGYKMLANNPYFMKYGPYGSYYGSGYDSYLSNWSPK